LLRHYDFSKTAVLETDASDYAIGVVLSQYDAHGMLQPCAFFSRKMNPAEINYDIHDKELLAIVESLHAWRHYVVSVPANEPLTILSDHKNLVRFSSKLSLSRQQFRWSETLSQFNFRILHCAGNLNGKADALSRHSKYAFGPNDPRILHNDRAIFRTTGPARALVLDDSICLDASTIASSYQTSFLADVRKATAASDLLASFREGTLKPGYVLDDNLLFFDGALVIPSKDLQSQVLATRHDSPIGGDFGIAKTFELISRDFFWPGIRRSIRAYICSCDACLRAKATRNKPYRLLKPLPVPVECWHDVSLDFVFGLPLSSGFDSILVVKDRLSKRAHYLPCLTTINAPETADLFFREIFRLHGLPKTIVSDRGPQFASKFLKCLFEVLG
jgi:hypothetical protein